MADFLPILGERIPKSGSTCFEIVHFRQNQSVLFSGDFTFPLVPPVKTAYSTHVVSLYEWRRNMWGMNLKNFKPDWVYVINSWGITSNTRISPTVSGLDRNSTHSVFHYGFIRISSLTNRNWTSYAVSWWRVYMIQIRSGFFEKSGRFEWR